MRHKIAIQGISGRVGSAVAELLSPHYEICGADAVSPRPEHFAVINAAPYHTSVPLCRAAIASGVHYLDLTEDVAVAQQLKHMASHSDVCSAVIPQCGLAPGIVSIVAADLAKRFDRLKTLRLRVGCLPVAPCNALRYALTWNVEGLLNQYSAAAQEVRGGQLITVPALSGVEELIFDGRCYEAFATSGGAGTLCDTFPEADEINYKTIRYPGHAALMKFLMQDLAIDRNALADILDRAIPATEQDVALISVTAIGITSNGDLAQHCYTKTIYGELGMTALRRTTATSVCAVVDMLATGVLDKTGFVRQEDIGWPTFAANKFGKLFV